MANARRLGAVLWLVGIVLALAMWPLSPLDREIGDAGWAVGAFLALTGLASAAALRSGRFEWSFGTMLASGYFGVAGVVALQWLAGGEDAPYQQLMLLPLLHVSAIHPRSRVLPFLAAVAAGLAAPFLYGDPSANATADAIVTFVLWASLAGLVLLLMQTVRAQRLSMRRQQSAAREEARLDELTGIGNRRAFEEALADEILRAGRMGTPLSIAMSDIANFKEVNDRFGHLEGDRCLREAARTIRSQLRALDRCFRWGGDEFVLVLPGTPRSGAEALVERLRSHVEVRCRRPDGGPLVLRFGVATLGQGMEAPDLLETADLALLAAKSRGAAEAKATEPKAEGS